MWHREGTGQITIGTNLSRCCEDLPTMVRKFTGTVERNHLERYSIYFKHAVYWNCFTRSRHSIDRDFQDIAGFKHSSVRFLSEERLILKNDFRFTEMFDFSALIAPAVPKATTDFQPLSCVRALNAES